MIFQTLFYIGIGFATILFGTAIRSIKSFKYSKLLFIILVFSLFAFLSGFKSTSIGRDTSSYLEGFNHLSKTGWTQMRFGNFELGYCLLMKIFGKLGLSFQIFNIFIYFVSYTLFAIAIYFLADDYVVATFLFYIFMFCFGLSAQRMFFSISIISFAMIFLRGKKALNCIIFAALVIVAYFFHKTSIVALLLIPLSFLKLNDKRFILSIVLIGILFVLCVPLYKFFIYKIYLSSYLPTTGGTGLLFWILLLLVISLYIFIIVNRKQTRVSNYIFEGNVLDFKKIQFNFWISLLGIAFMAFTPASENFPRFFYEFCIGIILVISYEVSCIKNRKFKFLLYVVIIILFTIFMFVTVLHNDPLKIMPYRLFF